MQKAFFLILLVVGASVSEVYSCTVGGVAALAVCAQAYGQALVKAGTDKSKYCPAFRTFKTCAEKVSGCTSSEIQKAIKAVADELKSKFGITCGGDMAKVSLVSILVAFVASRLSH